jgi:hypothetical protein
LGFGGVEGEREEREEIIAEAGHGGFGLSWRGREK